MATVQRPASKAVWAGAFACALLVSSTALAGGLELLPGGTRSVGRGGAVMLRADEPMTLLHNPAGLARITGQQLMLEIDVPLHDMCFDPYGYYGWGVYEAGESEFGNSGTTTSYTEDPLDDVCNTGPVTPIPQLAWAGRFGDDIGIGLGFVAPTLVGGMQFGGKDGTIATPDGARPTPTRYQLIRQQVLFGLNPTLGVGYRVLPQLRLGVALQVLMVKARSWVAQSVGGGTAPEDAMLVELTAEDYFIPAVTFGVHATPWAGFDVGAAFRWSDGFDGSGEVAYETNTYQVGSTSGPVPFANDPIELEIVRVRLPYVLTGGVRYAGLLHDGIEAEAAGTYDPMAHELWDIELDATYTLNERAGRNSAKVGEDIRVGFRQADGMIDLREVAEEMVEQFDVDRHFKDTVAVRLGGSWAFLPRTLTAHAGAFFETRGVDPDYANIDTFALQRIGMGVGVVLRTGSFDLLAAYGHILSESLDVAPPEHEEVTASNRGPTRGFDQRTGGFDPVTGDNPNEPLEDPDAPSPGSADGVASLRLPALIETETRRARVVNAGKYTANFSIISIGAIYHW